MPLMYMAMPNASNLYSFWELTEVEWQKQVTAIEQGGQTKGGPGFPLDFHRRILFSDLMKYQQQIDEKRLQALQELADQAQELDLDY